jgi:hypothetical protein
MSKGKWRKGWKRVNSALVCPQAIHLLHRLDEFPIGPRDHRLLQPASARPGDRLRRRERGPRRVQGLDGGNPGLLRDAEHR